MSDMEKNALVAEVRKLAKRANQRIVRLERLVSSEGYEGVTPDALELAHYYLDKRELHRFPEHPAKYSTSDLYDLRIEITNFLNERTSKAGEVKAVNREIKKLQKKWEEYSQKASEDRQAGSGANDNRKEGLENVDNVVINSPDKFMNIMRLFHQLNLDKVFDYRTIAQNISIIQDLDDIDIIKAVHALSDDKDLTRRKMRKRFEKIRSSREQS